MLSYLFYIILGFISGILSGLFGIGGGTLIIPGLMYIMGFSQLMAQGTSLAILLPPVGLLGFLEYYKNGNVNIIAGILICITMFIGTKFGGRFANNLPQGIMQKAFAVFLILIALKMFFGK
ncbi:sulfite exporter TauE/SafE [Clostridium pasteurianum DSM 525 = ATCC 6013]|uniref:Probable membrane transporter protein n=1 Tax=Clostridium pasteurianum DSM 525 = ATCC 6013 TaxID=1262449 RepID=A0A0H3IXV1_CLOPA|nr:sulfite exporter TauE/SafE family protein [Clostridium pasteurianum]AJA46316.1 sulfite exporter TauE/SafE [Clostridium pasteurianum DSM 525 = ATCC 6013]AJA50304.1 sulfite exporter TauE/SafE [Clostridium pasteurianum DSM 525 = ATCC 6013]AOZ73761.1 permease [Clostridium pasteurianum DSM 525 = ATCC 6013]AOZ77558.1 permease [Clostridium pasteurianum]ELP60894.1 permease [Clostridium pasteurianum DSM 525 = ATCC 6013]